MVLHERARRHARRRGSRTGRAGIASLESPLRGMVPGRTVPRFSRVRQPDDRKRRQMALLALARLEKSDVTSAIRAITEIDARTLSVDRVSAWFFNEDRSEIVCADLFELGPGRHSDGLRLAARDYPSYFRALEEERVVDAVNARTDPRTREFTDTYLVPLGIHSMMDVPIWLGGALVGVVCHEQTSGPRKWSPADQEFAAHIADMVTVALESAERTRAEAEIQRMAAEARRRAAEWEAVVQSIAEFVLLIDADCRVVFVNEAARARLGAATAEELHVPFAELTERFLEIRDLADRPLRDGFHLLDRALAGEPVHGALLRTFGRPASSCTCGPPPAPCPAPRANWPAWSLWASTSPRLCISSGSRRISSPRSPTSSKRRSRSSRATRRCSRVFHLTHRLDFRAPSTPSARASTASTPSSSASSRPRPSGARSGRGTEHLRSPAPGRGSRARGGCLGTHPPDSGGARPAAVRDRRSRTDRASAAQPSVECRQVLAQGRRHRGNRRPPRERGGRLGP